MMWHYRLAQAYGDPGAAIFCDGRVNLMCDSFDIRKEDP